MGIKLTLAPGQSERFAFMLGVAENWEAAAALKARIILSRYLGLNCAPGALTGFTVAVVAILATVAFSFVASAFLH